MEEPRKIPTILYVQETLAAIMSEREKELKAAHEQAMQDLAEARSREEDRQNAAREAQKQAKERKQRTDQASQAAETERLRQEAEEKRAIEQELNRKQEEADRVAKAKDELKRKLEELEHTEEMANKALRDAELQALPKVDTERIMPNPLQRFFQTQE